MPPVQIAHLLAEFPEVDSEPAWQAGPVDVALLDPHLFILESHEDFGTGVGIESRLKSELELAGHEGILLLAFPGYQPDITRRADLGVEEIGSPRALLGWRRLRLFRLGRVRLSSAAGLPRCLRRGGPDRRKIVGGIRSLSRCRPGCRTRRTAHLAQRGKPPLQ